ncbi:unnamed protein product, partial [Prorocentrum cordatum]
MGAGGYGGPPPFNASPFPGFPGVPANFGQMGMPPLGVMPNQQMSQPGAMAYGVAPAQPYPGEVQQGACAGGYHEQGRRGDGRGRGDGGGRGRGDGRGRGGPGAGGPGGGRGGKAGDRKGCVGKAGGGKGGGGAKGGEGGCKGSGRGRGGDGGFAGAAEAPAPGAAPGAGGGRGGQPRGDRPPRAERGKDGEGKGRGKGKDARKGLPGGKMGMPGMPLMGKGCFKGKGMGKGKGKSTSLMRWVDPALKVWIGNLADNTSWKDLQTHMNQAGATKWVEVFSGRGKGTGAAVYSTEEEVAKAIEELNGKEFGDPPVALEVDVWVKQ